jgi:polar amino acid transport system permease protein
VRVAVTAYVEVIRNTPFLVQLFIIYFSLPAIGIRNGRGHRGASLGMSINFRGLRDGDRARGHRGRAAQPDRGRAVDGVRRAADLPPHRRVPALRTVYPALASQFILLMLGSSIVAAISAEELTAVTNSLQSTTFRSFEFYFVATGMYLAHGAARASSASRSIGRVRARPPAAQAWAR